VKRHFQNACVGTGQSSIGKPVAISVKVVHELAPLESLNQLLLTGVKMAERSAREQE
jgi:hypothetical protein